MEAVWRERCQAQSKAKARLEEAARRARNEHFKQLEAARATEDALRVERALTEQLLRVAVASAFDGRESCSVATMQRCVGGEITRTLLLRIAEADLALIDYGRHHSSPESAARDPRARFMNLNYEPPMKKSKAEAEEVCSEGESDASESEHE